MKQQFIRFFLIAMVTTTLSSHAIGESNSEWEASLLGPDTFWGEATNGVKSALHVEQLSGTNMLIRCTPILKNTNTNILSLNLPPLKSRFIMEFRDNNGKAVTKTQKGKDFKKALTDPLYLTTGINTPAGYGRLPPLHPNYSEMLDGYDFVLQDYFLITNSGKYNLTFQMKVVWFPSDWKGSLKTTNVPVINLPAVNAQIEIKQTTPP